MDIVTPLTPAKSVSSLSISAPAAVTLAVSVTSAEDSTLSNLVSCASVINLLLVASDILAVPKVGLAPDITDWSNALTSAIDASSESIKAPAAVTLAVSVTSALVSIPVNLVWSAADITPDTLSVATGITASVPSEETIVLAASVPVIDKFVVTFSVTVTTPVLPLTLVTASVGVANNV